MAPKGWSETCTGGMMISNDPLAGGLVDCAILGKWFVIPNHPNIPMMEHFETRDEAYAALLNAVRNIQ